MALEYLQTIGKAKDELKSASSPVGLVAKKFAEDMIAKMKENVAPSNASGALSASIGFDFTKSDDGNLELNFIANDYWDFINSGVNGTESSFSSAYTFAQYAKTPTDGQTFQESLKDWFATKGITAQDGDYDSLAYIVMQSIKRKGIEPTHFMDEALTDESIEKLEEDLFQAFQSML